MGNLFMSACLLMCSVACGSPSLSLDVPDYEIVTKPLSHLQGNPIWVDIVGATTTSEVLKSTFKGRSIGTFVYANKVSMLLPADLREAPGDYSLDVTFANGKQIKKTISIESRVKEEKKFYIPETLGGNTKTSQDKLVQTLADEASTLLNLKTSKTPWWSTSFRYPLEKIKIVDPYGYIRKTGEYNLAHKGTDFDADMGTKVFAMNTGVVRIVRDYRNYGKTVVIDHGQNILTIYMHLSETRVNVGELVKKGHVIALTGSTGYSFGPHLHLTVRINDISIDPIEFLNLFK